MQLSTRHLLGIRDLEPQDVQKILDTAQQFKEVLQRPIKKVPSLRDITIVNLFYENSTRTRISFELAEKRLSADTINFTASGSSVSKGETLLDTVNNILSMKVDMVVMRHSATGAPHFLSKRVPAVIVNAGDGINEHPTQALLDAFTIREKLGSLEGARVAIIGDIMHSRVALSNIYLLRKMGAEVMLSGPPTLIPRHIEEAFKCLIVLKWMSVKITVPQEPMLHILKKDCRTGLVLWTLTVCIPVLFVRLTWVQKLL